MESVSTLSSRISSGYSPKARSTNHSSPFTGVFFIEERNPSTGLARGLVDQVRPMAIVNKSAGRNPRNVYTAYKRATQRSLPEVVER